MEISSIIYSFFNSNADKIFYSCLLLVFFVISFMILRATNFEKIFKQGKTTEIRIGYFIVSLIMAHVLSMIFMYVIV